MATIMAVQKAGSRHKAGNYRPVSLTSILCRRLEQIIKDQLCSHLVNNRCLTLAQHGFVKNRSCLTNLLVFLEESKIVVVCYLDFSKVFDSVSHSLPDHKLPAFGITGSARK